MKKMFYPAVFHRAEEGGYWITFPDIPECITEGDNMEEAYNMAVDALGLALTDRIKEKQDLPKASDRPYCVLAIPTQFLSLIISSIHNAFPFTSSGVPLFTSFPFSVFSKKERKAPGIIGETFMDFQPSCTPTLV